MSVPVLERSERIWRSVALRDWSGLRSGPISNSSSGTPISTTSPSCTDVLSRIAETSRNDTIAPANRAVTSITLPMWERSVVPIAMTSPVLTLRGSEPPRRTDCRVVSCTIR